MSSKVFTGSKINGRMTGYPQNHKQDSGFYEVNQLADNENNSTQKRSLSQVLDNYTLVSRYMYM